MPNPSWFNEAYFIGQKVLQMNATGWPGADGQPKYDWVDADWAQALADFNAANNTNIEPFDNFTACNEAGYGAGITRADINVSPNALFNVGVYATNVAAAANAQNYVSPAGNTGPWTADSALNLMLNEFHASAWDHYTTTWANDLTVNPSNEFDTSTYIANRVQAMNDYQNADGSVGYQGRTDWTEADVISELQAAGNNPIMDYFLVGKDTFGLEAPITTDAPVTTPADFLQWGVAGETPAELDPYDQDVTVVPIVKGQDVYPGEGETYTGNTRFEAVWAGNQASTLAASDSITGPKDQYNTLAVDLGKNWGGFSGKLTDADGKPVDNVTNVGRIQLTNVSNGGEGSYTFNASGISNDAVRYDLIGGDGPGTISLKNLSAAVDEIHISNLVPKNVGANNPTTNLEFVNDAVKGKDDSLTLVLTDVAGSQGGAAAIKATKGFETLNLVANKGENNSDIVDLGGIDGVKTLNVSGAGNLTVTNAASTIKTYDASTATGTLNLAYSGSSTGTKVIGGQGNSDTLTITGGNGPATMTGVEMLATNTATANINAKGYEDVQQLWVNTPSSAINVTNLTATDFYVHQTVSSEASGGAQATITVNGKDGSLENIDFITRSNDDKSVFLKSNFTTNATGNLNVVVGGKDTLLSGAITASKAAGNATLTVAENATVGASGSGIDLTAGSASEFTATINGKFYADHSTFTVVNNAKDPGGSVTISAENGLLGDGASGEVQSGLVLEAAGATTLTINSNGDFMLGSASTLANVQDMTLNLESTASGAAHSTFGMSGVNLNAAHNITVNAGGENVTLANLGTTKGVSDVNLTVNDANTFTVGDIAASLGNNIVVDITAASDVTLGALETATNLTNDGLAGDISLTVSTDTNVQLAAAATFKGGDITIDVSGVAGSAFTSKALTLDSDGAITYTGATKGNGATGSEIKITDVGADSTSNITLGDGADALTIAMASDSAIGTSTINVDLAGGSDTLTVTGGSGGNLVVNVTGDIVSGSDTIAVSGSDTAITTDNVNTVLKACGLSEISTTDLTITGGKFVVGEDAYWVGATVAGTTVTNATVVIVEDATAAIFS